MEEETVVDHYLQYTVEDNTIQLVSTATYGGSL